MQIGLGLDFTLGLSFEEQAVIAREAAELGYEQLWTPEGSGLDSFQLCALRWEATRDVVPAGLATGISVSPVAYRTPMGFAMSAGTLSQRSGGRFVLGIGSGGVYRPEFRATMGIPTHSALAVVRDYLATIRGLLAGDEVNYEGPALTIRAQRLGIDPPPRTPVYLGALGPRMLELGSEAADGICLNWCTVEQVQVAREHVDAEAKRAGREPGSIPLVEYIRVCVDDDVAAARAALARATVGYALGAAPGGRDRRFGYRPHFERMGFGEELDELEERRSSGASEDEIASAASDDLLLGVAHYGPAEGARQHFLQLAQGLDVAVVRVVPVRRGVDSVRAVMRACAPEPG